MCIVYNTVGSLSVIKAHLKRHKIEFASVDELILFRKNFVDTHRHILSDEEYLVNLERNTLAAEIPQLENSLNEKRVNLENELQQNLVKLKLQFRTLLIKSEGIIEVAKNFCKRSYLISRIVIDKAYIRYRIWYSTWRSVASLNKKKRRHDYIVSNFNEAVNRGCRVKMKGLEKKKKVIDEINTFLYGALGEQNVVKELENLSDDYFLINDFSMSFKRPLYYRKEKGYIKSIQADHILVSPAGVFLIETKNWSQQSVNNLDLRSPVQQIQRTNFAMFIMLNGDLGQSTLNIKRHHWGDTRIPIKNLIVMMRFKPEEEFQYVKVLALDELLRYVKYFKPVFSREETKVVAHYLLNCRA